MQNNVSIYEEVILEDDVFCGPSCVFTNVLNPRSHIPRKNEYRPDVPDYALVYGNPARLEGWVCSCGVKL